MYFSLQIIDSLPQKICYCFLRLAVLNSFWSLSAGWASTIYWLLGHIYFDGGLVSLLGFTRVKWSGCTIVHEAAWDGISRVVSVVHRCLSKMALCLEKKISQKILLFAVWMDSDWWGGINTFFIPIVNFLLSLFFPLLFSLWGPCCRQQTNRWIPFSSSSCFHFSQIIRRRRWPRSLKLMALSIKHTRSYFRPKLDLPSRNVCVFFVRLLFPLRKEEEKIK